MTVTADSPASLALAAARAGRLDAAEAILRQLVQEEFGLTPVTLSIGRDGYSLNSVNGFLRTADGGDFFFKFHHEEGEEQTLREFYQAELLRDAGYPVDQPVHASRRVGRQILLYRRRDTPRFADLCRDLDETADTATLAPAIAAQQVLDDLTVGIYRRSLHPITEAQSAGEPIHQLFAARLSEPEQPESLGGRARRFFQSDFDLAGTRLSAERLLAARWTINGIVYRDGIGALLERSRIALSPARLARFGGVTAHGDAHNANVWWEADRTPPRLAFFDPAFAGAHVPALLAEVKATFHNILAHPLWLYHAEAAAARYHPRVTLDGDRIAITHDWAPTPLRRAFLDSKVARLWRPLLAEMAGQGLLPADWRETLRLALFCCPTLVMELRAGGSGRHNPISSAIGLAIAVMAGSEPEAGRDGMTEFLDAIDPGRRPRTGAAG